MELDTLALQNLRNFVFNSLLAKFFLQLFWNCHRITMNFLDKGRTITGNYYSTVLTTLRKRIMERRRRKISKGMLFLQDNAPALKSHVAMQTVRDLGCELLEHTHY